MTFALSFSMFIAGSLFGVLATCYTVFLCIKKQDGTLVRTSCGEFLQELGESIKKATPETTNVTKIS